MNYEVYDIIIVGAGPAGLALAHCCSSLNKKILIIEKEHTIGGCHRVKRITNQDLFTEHGPRIYYSIYKNVFQLLNEMGLSIDDVFTKYYYTTMSLIIDKLLPNLTFSEILAFLKAYLFYIVNETYGSDISLKQFCENNNYSVRAIDIFDRMGRLSDGATIDKYSLNTMLKLADANPGILQPKGPLDKVLFNKWQKYLEKRNVHFLLGHTIKNIYCDEDLKQIDFVILDDNRKYYAKHLVLAVPPANLIKIIENQQYIVKNAFGNFKSLREWTHNTEYIEYISITYHYKNKIEVPKVSGMTIHSDWGVVIVNLTNYMQYPKPDQHYAVTFSLAITIPDKQSKYTKKTANQTRDPDELAKEAFRQINQEIYNSSLPMYDVGIVNPNNYYDNAKQNWDCTDEAYFHTLGTKFLPSNSKYIHNIYTLGTHNGNSYIDFTTMESAVTNGIVLAKKLYPKQLHYKVQGYLVYRDIIIYVIVFLLLVILCYLLVKLST
jgi:protoporphyrinogen oxidase